MLVFLLPVFLLHQHRLHKVCVKIPCTEQLLILCLE
jgi:hypothetical protein